MRLSDRLPSRSFHAGSGAGGCGNPEKRAGGFHPDVVPSQINYVLTSRVHPGAGGIWWRAAGRGGYIRITRINSGRGAAIMHVVNSIGDTLDASTARIILENLTHNRQLAPKAAKLMRAAVSDNCYHSVPPENRDAVRAAVLKSMLLQAAMFD